MSYFYRLVEAAARMDRRYRAGAKRTTNWCEWYGHLPPAVQGHKGSVLEDHQFHLVMPVVLPGIGLPGEGRETSLLEREVVVSISQHRLQNEINEVTIRDAIYIVSSTLAA